LFAQTSVPFAKEYLTSMGTNTTAESLLLSTKVDNTPVLVAGLLHLLCFPLIAIATYVNFKSAYMKRIRQDVDYILCIFLAYGLLFEFVNWSFLLGGGFSRAGMVTGNPAYSSDQLGYLNSKSTPFCVALGYFLNCSACGMVGFTFLLSHNTYNIVIGNGTRGPARSKTKLGQPKWYQRKLLVGMVALSLLLPLVAAASTDFGPLALYCWIRCNEDGMDGEYTNNGKCWWRLASMYAWFFIFGIPAVFYSIQVLRKLNAHSKTMASTAHGNATKVALRKLGGFTMVFAFICTVASIVRVPSSLNPKGPVSISSVEYGTLLIPTAGFWLFGVGKIREHLNCNWAKNTEKRGSNLVYSSENTTNNDPGSNNSKQATPQNSSPYVVKKGDAKAPPTADNSQQQVV
jgi:hypothetical protein